MKHIVERPDGLFTLNTNANYRCVTKNAAGVWVGGVFDSRAGQFSDGRRIERGMSAAALSRTYTATFKTKREALAWVMEEL